MPSGDALDILYDGKSFHRFSAERIPTKNTHGTGCTYSSAIASNLALGFALAGSGHTGKGVCHDGNPPLAGDWKGLRADPSFL